MVPTIIKIALDGHVDDLYTLSLLFSNDSYPSLRVVTRLVGEKEGLYDRVKNIDCRDTYLTGDGCLPLISAGSAKEMSWMAYDIIAPLNGYATLTDSNFKPVVPVSVSWTSDGASGGASFESFVSNLPTRAIVSRRHDLIEHLMPSRVSFMSNNPLAAYAAAVIAGRPSWADYYRLLEDIAGHRGTTLDKLTKIGLAERRSLDEFKRAANNRISGRHGASKRDESVSQENLMTLTEAREFTRRVITAWFDRECGGRLPRDRVDGEALRFGLDD
ncbi:hypothetical protein GE543_09500 [Pseudomonas sp. SZ57]|uniref:hypothetical protein n=1 Tax=Pseudomonas sp. SZ57 TaxID=2662259 RepID=UPI0012924926|nr:hypothetical protein [Pseudomonas sp. SZ57]MQQ34588.1 hypothetical protein [Pseudomonas sp. SZ57]